MCLQTPKFQQIPWLCYSTFLLKILELHQNSFKRNLILNYFYP